MTKIEVMLLCLAILFIGYGAVCQPTFVDSMSLSLWTIVCYLFFNNEVEKMRKFGW